jgi:hypothetical protein
LDNRFLRNVVLKGLGLFIICNLLVAVWYPSGLNRISLYNHLYPGRERFPFGENPTQAYNLSLFDLDAMFASHIIGGRPKTADEYRVFLIGDSSVWGTLLHPEETLAGQLNAASLSVCGKTVRVYNLGYPTISLIKDVLILDQAMSYQPDLILWLVTLEAFPIDKQLTSPIVSNNAEYVRTLIAKYDLSFDPYDPAFMQINWWNKTIIGQRRSLADLLRLQMYGVLWTATGIDQTYPLDYSRAQTDFEADLSFHDFQSPMLRKSQLAFDVLTAGLHTGENTPLLLINEPMLISVGENSDIRYNFFYPRWAYDQYRQMMTDYARINGVNYLDLWNILPDSKYYTNSAIHLTSAGESVLAGQIAEAISQQTCP